jgi:ABC-type transport system involved in multi-copper enzyme maturation permease subunit
VNGWEDLTGCFSAELLKLRKRTAVWVLGGILVAIVVLLIYGISYAVLRSPAMVGRLPPGETSRDLMRVLFPFNFVATAAQQTSGLGGALAVILGVLSIGSEYGWGTLKTILSQRPSRADTFVGRLLALVVVTGVFTLLTFAACAVCSALIGALEGAGGGWPDAGEILRAFLAGWLITTFWACFGMMLATLFQQSALAIGIGLVYSILFEGLVFGLLRGLSLVENIEKAFPGVNATALAGSFRVSGVVAERGAQAQALVGADQAALVLAAYLLACVIVAGVVLQRRDVIG